MTQEQEKTGEAPASLWVIAAILILTGGVLAAVVSLLIGGDDGPIVVVDAKNRDEGGKPPEAVLVYITEKGLRRGHPKMANVYAAVKAHTRNQQYAKVYDLFHPDYQEELVERVDGWRALVESLGDPESGKSEAWIAKSRRQIRSIMKKLGFSRRADITQLAKLSAREVFGRQYQYMIEKGGERSIRDLLIVDAERGVLKTDETDGAILTDASLKAIIEEPKDIGRAFLILHFEVIDRDASIDESFMAGGGRGESYKLLVLLLWDEDEKKWRITRFAPLMYKLDVPKPDTASPS